MEKYNSNKAISKRVLWRIILLSRCILLDKAKCYPRLLRLGSRWGSGRIQQNQSAQKVQKTKKSSWFHKKSGTFWWRLLDSNQWPPACEAGALTSWAKPPGDPYETRTRVTAVKGRCLNHLTNGPYMPESIFRCFLVLVAATGFEPVTLRVWTECSSQLSYTAI